MVAEWKHESHGSTRTVRMPVAAQVANIAFEVIVAPQSDSRACTNLVYNRQVALQEDIRSDGDNRTAIRIELSGGKGRVAAVQHRIIEEALGPKFSNFTQLEDVVERKSRLTQVSPPSRHLKMY